MARVRRMHTQDADFWQSELTISADDLDHLTGLVLESGQPFGIDDLSSALMVRLVRREKDRAARQITDGDVYRPADSFEMGKTVVFTEQDFATARVVGIRPGVNPRYGDFQVIRVAFEDGIEREFASGLKAEHALNRPTDELVGGTADDLSEADLVATYAPDVTPKLAKALDRSESWVQFDGLWFLRELLPEFHVGHLNLAEAAIDEVHQPISAGDMLDRLEMGLPGARTAQLFALNVALGEDPRFYNVGTRTRQIWYLRGLMPEAAFERPLVHRDPMAATAGEFVGLTMLDIVDKLGDELDAVPGAPSGRSGPIAFQVNFPHLYAGTMPAPAALLSLLTYDEGELVPVTLVDARNNRTYEGWAVPAQRYVAGLGPWYKATGMVVGGLVSVTQGDEPRTFRLAITVPRSSGSEWVKSASATEAGLSIQMQPRSIAIRHDPATLIDVPDRDAIARLMSQTLVASRSPFGLVRAVFAELAKLSPQGVANCQAVYSAVNMYRRSGAVPIFGIMTRNACFDPVGNGDWVYDGSLEGQTYDSPEAMRERPLSHRNDLVRDQVVRFGN